MIEDRSDRDEIVVGGTPRREAGDLRPDGGTRLDDRPRDAGHERTAAEEQPRQQVESARAGYVLDARAVALADGDQAGRCDSLESLAHRRPGDPQHPRQFPLAGERLAGSQIAGQHAFDDLVEDDLGCALLGHRLEGHTCDGNHARSGGQVVRPISSPEARPARGRVVFTSRIRGEVAILLGQRS